MNRLSQRATWAAVLAFLCWSAASMAASLEDAEALFAQGDFLAAADLAREANSASGLALAARATLAHAEFRATPKQRLAEVRAAEAFARAALAMDAEHVEALIQLSLAVGYLARHKGALAAHFQGLVEEGRDYLLRAVALQPENAWANATLGAWHLEVVNQGGVLVASSIYGADKRTGIGYFDRAIALDPDNAALRFETALALLALDSKKYLTQAVGHLEAAVALEPRAALDRFAQDRAKRLLEAAQNHDQRLLKREISEIKDLRNLAGKARPIDDTRK